MNVSQPKYIRPTQRICMECVIAWLAGPVLSISLIVWAWRSIFQ